MKKFNVTIIIPSWNTADITIKCIHTIKQYLTGLNYDIIVVDNGSQDDSVIKLKKENRIKLIENPTNLGFGQANNIAAKIAKGDYLLFLNSDIELIDSKLIDMLNYIDTHPEIGLISPKFLNLDLSEQGSVFPPQNIINALKEFWLGQSAYSKYVPKTDQPLEVWSVSGGAMIIKQSLFEKIGGWDSRYFMYFEDLELCRQVKKLGYKIYYYPQCCVIHHHGASGKFLSDTKNQWRRLIPSSKIYHGLFKHYLLFLIIWSGQKFHKFKF
jgi:GT2 family glycosyltransferase